MLHKQRYFDRNGREVAEDEAMRAGVLRDGFSLRIPTTLRDSTRFSDGGRAFWDANRDTLCVVDPRRVGGAEQGCRPGFRVFDNDLGRQAIADAHTAYRHDLENQWRNPPRDAAPPPDQEEDEDDEDEDELPQGKRVRPVTADAMSAAHQQNMARVYDAYARELAEAWRKR
jgi:hypothetical protein